MQLTRAADYALRVMIHLAAQPAGSRASRETLAEATQVPPQFMGKVLQALTRAELIKSHRGSLGGFELGRPSNQLNVLQVIEAIEGPICLNVCLTGGEGCGRSWWCSGHTVWQEAQAALVGVLRDATLDRLAAEATARLQAGPAPVVLVDGGPLWN